VRTSGSLDTGAWKDNRMGIVSPCVVMCFREKWANLGTKQTASDDDTERERERNFSTFFSCRCLNLWPGLYPTLII